MKRILSLALILMLLMSSFLLVSCDDKGDDPVASTTAATTEAPDDDSEGGGSSTPAAPVAVEKANGKTAGELFTSFIQAIQLAKTYDIEVDATIPDEGSPGDVRYDLKLGDEELYMNIAAGGQNTVYWVVDGVMYGMSGETKVKMPVENFEECSVLPMFSNLIINLFLCDNVEDMLAKVSEAQLYSYKGEFYYERALTEREADNYDMEIDSATETLYFNAHGKAIKKILDDGKTSITITINGYDTPVVVKAPEDPDSFVETDSIGGGTARPDDGNDEVYDLYLDIYDRIDRAEIYALEITIDGEPSLSYALTGNSVEYLRADAEGEYCEMWILGDHGFVRQNGVGDVANVDADTLSVTFDSVRSQKDALRNYRFAKSELEHLSIGRGSEWSSIHAVYKATESVSYCYNISFANDFSGIDVEFITEVDGVQASSVLHSFRHIDDIDFALYIP